MREFLDGNVLQPPPAQRRLPIRVASWGSRGGPYNTTPERFGRDLKLVLEDVRDPTSFANAIATGWMYITESRSDADRMLTDVLAPMLRRPVDSLRELSLPIGPVEVCTERLAAFAHAGAERLFVWPLADPVRQLELFRERVAPLV